MLGARTLHATAVSRAQDYYDVLGLPKTASTGDIKRKYYEKAKQYHPDTNKNDPEAAKKFAAATEAYEVQPRGSCGTAGARCGDGHQRARAAPRRRC